MRLPEPVAARLRDPRVGHANKAIGGGMRPFGLTAREAQVLDLMRQGLSNADIAQRLVISKSTAKVHVHHVLEKMQARSRVEAVVRAREP